MAYILQWLIFCVLFLRNCQGNSHGDVQCLEQDCKHYSDIKSCIHSSHNHWRCKPDEFCQIDVDSRGSKMTCRSLADLPACNLQGQGNDDGCDVNNESHPESCTWCCANKNCTFQPSVTSQRRITSQITRHRRAAHNSCFMSYCDEHFPQLDSCTKGDWACGQDEFCQLELHKNGDLHMGCHKEVEIFHCYEHQSHHGTSCQQPAYYQPEDCHYCCQDEACILESLFRHLHLTPTSSTLSPPLVPGTEPVRAGHNSCFEADCPKGTPIHACVQGKWACGSDEFCQVETHTNGDTHMHCHHVSLHDTLNCMQDIGFGVVDGCQSLVPPFTVNCRFCCYDPACVMNKFSLIAPTSHTQTPASIPVSTPGSAQAATTLAQQTVAKQTVPTASTPPQTTARAGHNSCFQADCPKGTPIHVCVQGQWACGSDEFCQVETHTNGDTHMHCHHVSLHDTLNCMQDIGFSVVDGCQSLVPPFTVNCRFCCYDPVCVMNKFSLISPTSHTQTQASTPVSIPGSAQTVTTLAQQTVAKQTVPTASTAPQTTAQLASSSATGQSTNRPVPTTSVPTAGQVTDCHDNYNGDCSVDFSNLCGNPTVSEQLCPKYCNTCLPCTDLYTNDCSVDFAGRCQDPMVQIACQHTCKLCSVSHQSLVDAHKASATATTHLDTTTTTYLDATTHLDTTTQSPLTSTGGGSTEPDCKDLYKGNCTEHFGGKCNVDLVRQVCPLMCGVCSPLTTISSATQAPGVSCVQCGNYANQTACTDLELLHDTVSPCQGATATRCMTDVFVDTNSVISVFKRCVQDDSCNRDWYHMTSDKPLCLHFDPDAGIRDLACHFCCVGDGCNLGTVPEKATQWRP